MDPDACLQRVADAPYHSEEMGAACDDLRAWLLRGGFAPTWARNIKGTRRYAKRYGLDLGELLP